MAGSIVPRLRHTECACHFVQLRISIGGFDRAVGHGTRSVPVTSRLHSSFAASLSLAVSFGCRRALFTASNSRSIANGLRM